LLAASFAAGTIWQSAIDRSTEEAIRHCQMLDALQRAPGFIARRPGQGVVAPVFKQRTHPDFAGG
jgi:hypothetical protein